MPSLPLRDQSVQQMRRKERLSGDDLTKLAREKSWGSHIIYNFGNKTNEGPQIGWYLHNPRQPAFLIGSNYIAARDFIAQMPTDSILKKYVPAFFRGAS